MHCSKRPSCPQLIRTFIGYLCLLAFSNSTWANTAGVFPPVVQEGHRSLQYRVTLNPDSGAFGTRLHYQESLNDDVMLRGIVHASESATGHSKVDFVQGELFWDLSEDTDRLRHGFRFDARARGRRTLVSAGFNTTFVRNGRISRVEYSLVWRQGSFRHPVSSTKPAKLSGKPSRQSKS